MDYLGWELERQWSALRALLPGGGEDREGGRRPSGPRPAAEAAAGRAGRIPPDAPEDAPAPGAWEAVRVARTGRLPRGNGGPSGGGARGWEEEPGPSERSGGKWPEGALGAAPRAEGEIAFPPSLRPGREGDFPAAGSAAGGGPEETGPAGGRGGAVLEFYDAGGRFFPGGADGAARRGGPWGGGAAALRAEEDAVALSRAVQRDARRYDGGFNIY